MNKVKKIISALMATAIAVSSLAVAAFAEPIDYTAVGEANNGLYFKASAGWAGGVWIAGSDTKAMDDPLTIADLEAADHFEIKYTSTEVPPTLTEGDTAKLTFCYKFVTEIDADGMPVTMEAYLPDGWYGYGPSAENGNGNSYHSIDLFAYDVESEGTLIVPTQAIIDSLVDKDAVLYMWQFGIGCNTYDFDSDWTDEADLGADYEINISSVILSDEPAPETEATETAAPETEAETEEVTEAETEAVETDAAETEAAETEAATEETTAAATDAPASAESGTSVWLIVVIIAAIIIVIVVIIVVVSKKKK